VPVGARDQQAHGGQPTASSSRRIVYTASTDREVDELDEVSFVLAHDVFLAGPAAPPVAPAGRLGVQHVVELRQALTWMFALAA
jgi:hypothetical protein